MIFMFANLHSVWFFWIDDNNMIMLWLIKVMITWVSQTQPSALRWLYLGGITLQLGHVINIHFKDNDIHVTKEA